MRTRKGYDSQPRLTCRFRVWRNVHQLLKRLSMQWSRDPSLGRERSLCENSIYPSKSLTMPSHFRIQWLPANGLVRPTVPVGCVALIAFPAMQVGVHPRTLRSFVPLSGFVRSRPIALGIPPQSSEGESESGWRLGRGD
jgi:hypothetical protein